MTYKVGKCLLPKHRQQKRWSQTELAARIKKSKQAVHSWEKNSVTMSYENALNVSKALGVAMEELYEIIEVKE